MKEIKTKPKSSGPKLLDSAARVPKTAMKDLWLESREKAVSEYKETLFSNQQEETSNAPANGAGDQMLSGMESTVRKGADLTYRGGKKLAQTNARKLREKREGSRALEEAKGAADQAGKAAQIKTKNAVVKGGVKGKPVKTVKTASRSVKGVKQSARSVKTAQRSAKTVQQTAKAAQTVAKSAKAAAQAARSAAKAAVTGAKEAVRVTAAAVKATIASVKGLAAAIAAGGWVAVVIIVIVCVVAMVVGMWIGIFRDHEEIGIGIYYR